MQTFSLDGSNRHVIVDPTDATPKPGRSYVLDFGADLGWFPADAARFHAAHSGGTIVGRVRWVMSPE